MWIKILFSIGLVTCLTFTLHAQDTATYPRLNCTYIKSYFTDTKAFVKSPGSWHTKQWIELGAVAGAGILAYSQDERLQRYFVNHQSVAASNWSDHLLRPFGDGLHSAGLIAGTYLTGLAIRNQRLSGTALTAAKSLAIATVGTHLVKQICHRHRPYQDVVPDHTKWDGPFGEMKYASFFSGHSSTAWSVATVFALEYQKTVWVPVLAYSLATGTAVSRMYDNRHWFSDVVVGSAFGFVTARFIWKHNHKAKQAIVLTPVFSESGSMLSLSLPIKYK